MSNYSRYRTFNLFISISAFLLLVYFVLGYYAQGDHPWFFYNGDNIYVAYFYHDLMQAGGSILQWKFSPVPYFFPDIFIYFVLAMLTQHLKLAILLQAVIQLALYYWLIVAIGKVVTKKFQPTTLFHLSVLFSLVLLANGQLQQETLQNALVTQQHFGTALMCMLGLLLILRSFTSHSSINYYCLFLVCFLTTFSDIVFITQFFTTAIASLCLIALGADKVLRKIYMKNMFAIIAGTLLSYALYRFRAFCLHISINPHLVRRSQVSELIAATEKIQQNFMVFYQHNAIVVLLLATFIFASLVFLMKNFLRKKDKYNNRFFFSILFLLMMIMMGYLSLIVADNDLMDNGYNGMRHSEPYLLFPVFLGIPLFLTRYTNLAEKVAKHYFSIVLALVGCTYLFSSRAPINLILNFYPPTISCLDQYAQQYHLQDGLANYWEAKSYSFLSKQHLNVAAIENNYRTQSLQPELWISTMHDYVGKNFNFLIVESDHFESANTAFIEKTFGAPQVVLECPAWENGKKDKIMIYQNGALNQWMKEQMQKPVYF